MPSKPQSNKNISTADSKTQQLTVIVRIRPVLHHERENEIITYKVDEKMVLLADPNAGDPVDVLRAKRAQDKKYVFDWTFDGDSSQEEVYEKTTKKLVENVINGYNGTVFAYGATGSGKTHTMVGSDNDPGIMVRALKDLFMEVDKEQNSYDVTMSYLEIYNEAIRDLLTPSLNHLELRENAKGNHQVVGLSEIKIASSQQVMSLLTKGNKQRTQESTGANRTSSRSHALLVVRVKKRMKPISDNRQKIRTGSLYMVDLAGSERAANTQNIGKRIIEGAHINKSLLALGNCINALAERHVRYVNFRDSKLTRLLKEPLTGNCRTVMVAHVSPLPQHYEETRNTLVYADRAKNITTKLRSNISDVSFHVAQYQSIISELRQEIQSLQQKIEERGHSDSTSASSQSSSSDFKIEKRLSEPEMKDVKERLIESFNTQMEVRRRMMEIDNTLLGHSIEFDKLNMILNEWETEKAVTAMDNNDNDRRSSGSTDTDMDDVSIPEQVRQAWEDLQYLKSQQQRYLQMREDCQHDYERCKENTHRATESLPDKKASSQEQRELLHLLARVYELEVEKMELQASQLLREHELRYRDFMLLRYDRQRQLCDDIITRQRQLIDALASDKDKSAGDARRELNELYRIYQQELQELASGRDSRGMVSSSGNNNNYRPGSGSIRPLGTSESMWELHHIKQNLYIAEQNPLPPIRSNGEFNGEEQLFRRRRVPPNSQSSNQDWSGGRKSDASDWSIRTHVSSDSPRVLPPLEKYSNDSPSKFTSDVSSQINKNCAVENNLRNNHVTEYSPASYNSKDSRRRSFTILKQRDMQVNDSSLTSRGKTLDLEQDLDQEDFEEESARLSEYRHRQVAGDLPRRYGLLPSLRQSMAPNTNHSTTRKGAASSDSEVSKRSHSKPRQPKPTPPYRNPGTERLLISKGSDRRSKSFDIVGYPFT